MELTLDQDTVHLSPLFVVPESFIPRVTLTLRGPAAATHAAELREALVTRTPLHLCLCGREPGVQEMTDVLVVSWAAADWDLPSLRTLTIEVALPAPITRVASSSPRG